MTTFKHRRITTLLATLLAGSTLAGVAAPHAWAQPADEIPPDDPELKPPPTNDPRERAKEFYLRGRKNYDLGKFRRAVALFTRAYEEFSDGAFLFNIAQSYRQLDDCKQALFFYKRFLSVQKNVPAATKKEVDGHVLQLEECVKKQEDIRKREPDGTKPPDDLGTGDPGTPGGTDVGGPGTTGGTSTGGTTTSEVRVANGGGQTGGDGDDGDDGGETPDGRPSKPRLIALFARGGAAKVGAGNDLNVPLQAAVSLSAGYPLAVGDKLALDLGVGFGFTPVPWGGGTSSLTTVAAHVGATYTVARKIGVRGELDVGATFFGGLEMGNPFTANGAPASAAISMLNVRAGLAVEYAITDNVAAVITPIAFAYSPAADNFAEGIDAITRLEFLAGLGYRM